MEKKEVLVTGNQNPVRELWARFKENENCLKKWSAKQSLPVDAAVAAATAAPQCAAITGAAHIFFKGIELVQGRMRALDLGAPKPPMFQEARRLLKGSVNRVKSFAICGGVYSCMCCVMERLRGKDDIEMTGVVAGYTSGAAFSFVRGYGYGGVLPMGSGIALLHVFMSKSEDDNLGQPSTGCTQTHVHVKEEKYSQPVAEDVLYTKTRDMLSSLSLDDYEKNFKKNLFTDKTLPLLTNRELQEAEIPTGARLLILDYIKRVAGGGKEDRFDG